jgi:F0F1-type ATP synthase membrane subunit b/b'
MLATLLALQAAETAHEGGLPGWIPQLVNLAIFVAILSYILRKPMTSFFETRRAAILAELEKAKREKNDAEAKLAEVEARLSRLEADQAEIRAESEREAEAEYARVIARAEQEARTIAETADREIESALKAARADLQRFAAEKAVDLAEATIRSEMNDADRSRMVEQYAAQIGGTK